MSSRKRSRLNPSFGESTTSLPATLPSQTTRVASQGNTTSSSSLSSATRRQGMPPIKRHHDANTSTPVNPNGSKQVRKSRSWYGSWPHVPKSSASTQVARETIMGDTLRPGAVPDFSRYEIQKGDGSTESDTQSIKTLPRISETEVRPKHEDSKPPGHQQERTGDRGSVNNQAGDGQTDTPANDGSASATSLATQRPQASSGWFSWLGRAPEPEKTTATNEITEVDPPQQPDTTPPPAAQEPSNHTETSPETPKTAKPSSSWFGYWYTSTTPTTSETTVPTATTDNSKDDQSGPKETREVTMEDAIPPAPNQPSTGSTWAFWSRDTGKQNSGKSTTTPEQGELAVIGDGSEASPRKSTGITVNEGTPPVKEPPTKTAKEPAVRSNNSKKKKKVHPPSIDIADSLPARPGTPHSDISTKTASTKPATPGLSNTHTQNLLLPSFRSTYHMKENSSIIKQITQLLLRTQQPSVNHVFLTKEPLKVKKAIAIGVHGLFPASFLRPVIGQPTGTSIRFANHCAEAIRRWADSHGCAGCEIEKVALEGEGKIADRVDNLWKLLLNWIDHIRRADLIIVACHSQGVPVGLMLLAKLIDLGMITNARIGVCAMAGVSLGPFPDYKSGMGMLMGSAAELWQFADPESEISKRYEHALEVVVNYGGRVTYVGSIDDQLVPMESAVYSPASHPYIYRAVFVDGRIHAPDFITHLVGFALKLRNLGISDHGLIRELSVPLAGSLYSGEGHSRLYDDEQVYDLAISHALETSSVSRVPCQIKKHEGLTNPNPYVLPWIMRGLLEEEFVRTELYSETTELLKQFDDWTPSTKALKDVKYRLEAVRSKL